MKNFFLKRLVLCLNLVGISAFAGGNGGGGGVRVGVGSIIEYANQVGKMSNSQGNFKSAGIGQGTMNNGQGNMQLAGGAEANSGNGGGTMKLVGGAEANFGSGGGGVLVEYRAIKSGGHEI